MPVILSAAKNLGMQLRFFAALRMTAEESTSGAKFTPLEANLALAINASTPGRCQHPVPKLVAREAEQRGGLHLVAVAVFKRLMHQAAFDCAQEDGQIDAGGRQVNVVL